MNSRVAQALPTFWDPEAVARMVEAGSGANVVLAVGGHTDFPAIGMRGKPDLWQPGKFVHPHDACFDKDGNIFIAEWVVGGRITKLRKLS